MKIQELAHKTGLTVYTIRFYEKEGLLDSRHFVREKNNYRNYSEEAVKRIGMIKKFQGVSCSLDEIRVILQEKEENTVTNQQVIDWVLWKISEVERKKDEYDQMLVTLNRMLEYRKAAGSIAERPVSHDSIS